MTARGWALFAAMSVIWGIPYLLIKVAVDEVSVPVLVFTRCAVGAVLLLPLAVSAGSRTLLRRHWKAVAAFAFFEMIAAWLLLSDAERHLTSSLTGLLIAAAPIIAAVLDRLTGGERLGPLRLAGLGLGLAGVAVLAGPGLSSGGARPVIEVMLTATCYAIAPLIAARYLADVPGPALTSACLGLAAVVYLTPAALTWPRHTLTPHAYAAIAALAGICTALAFVVFFALIKEVGATRALLFTYVNPAVALIAGVLLLSEPLTWFHIAGLTLILTGSVLASRTTSENVADE
ncbi:EamA family transporter [Mycobacterium sp. ENV421]|uniref:DMT family transporter n=1 Tax=Mycobacterium sp. ENV421 TaxID=1213407 RepID=UPI000C9B67C3|nr:DMT family transporter [Mycobacterium sp. ENV421]PND56654.1 EamA family transporter [Mycobacterium sp. ENV421]